MSESTAEETGNSVMPAKKKSIAWLYFVETAFPGKLACKICKRSSSFKRKSTSNLLRHMKKRHPDIYHNYTSSYSEFIRQMHPQHTSHAESEDETSVEALRIEDDKCDENEAEVMEKQCENAESTVEKTENTEIATKKTSIVWRYFVQTSFPNKLKCMQCNKFCSYNHKSTGNLIRHLKKKHPDINSSQTSSYSEHIRQVHPQDLSYSQSEDETAIEATRKDHEKNKDEVQAVETQCEFAVEASIPSNVAKEQDVQVQTYYLAEQIDTNQTKIFSNQILKLSVKNFYPFNLFENREFKMFVSMLNPNYDLPNAKTLSDDVLLKAYQCKVQELKCTLKELKYVALTIDKWVSIDDENFIALTVHYLDKDLINQSNFLDCISYHKDSFINIPVFLQELVHNWKISEKIVAVVCKDDPSIIDAIKECQWQHIPCFAHALNTTIMRCLTKINDTVTKVRAIVDYFKKTPNAMTKLLSLQVEKGIANVKLKKDAANRYNSTFDMITRLLKNKDILNSELIKDLPDELSLNEWHILESTVNLLIAFNTVTVELCSEKGVALSKVPYMIGFMLNHVTHIIDNILLPNNVKAMGEELKEVLLEQSKIIKANDIICQSVLLDPRLKKRGFPENIFESAYTSLLENVILLKNEKMFEAVIGQSGKQQNTKQEFYVDVWSEFRKTEKPPAKNCAPDARNEIDTFLSEAYISMKDNPMTYWGKDINQKKFPILFELVKSRLCVPASSVPCNNIFSEAGSALIERRNLLSSKNLKEVLFLHHNL